jgi:type IV pilus assembly protein PilV
MNDFTNKSTLVAMYRKCRGLTLVEILIALLVLSIGLLGLAALQTTSLSFNTSSYYRTQATALAYDFADRMRANRPDALDDQYLVAFQDPPPACGANVVAGDVPQQDIASWRNALACRIPQSTGSITRIGNEFTVTVQWNDTQGPMTFAVTTAL